MEAIETAPVLRSLGETETRDFYQRFLGFEEIFSHRFAPGQPLYLALGLGGAVLHLSEHQGDAVPGATVFLRIRGLAGFHAEISARGHPRMRPGIETHPWGRQMELTDPCGNRLRFCES